MEAKGGETDPVFMVNCFIKKRLTLEYAFYKLTNNVMFFYHFWGVDGFLCEPDGFEGFKINIF